MRWPARHSRSVPLPSWPRRPWFTRGSEIATVWAKYAAPARMGVEGTACSARRTVLGRGQLLGVGNPKDRGFRPLARERDETCDVIDSAARQESASCAIKNLRKGRRETRNAGHPDRHEKPRAKLTDAAGSHMSSTRRIRHGCLADIGPAPARALSASWSYC
jgi:hypothetical protein